MNAEATSPPVVRTLSAWAFLAIVVVYLAIIQGLGLIINAQVDLVDSKIATVADVLWVLWVPIGLALVFVLAVITFLRWWPPVLHDDKPVRRWLWFVPGVFVVGILLAIDYSELADKGFAFTIVLLIACQFVGWGEEGMFRGVSVVMLRQHQLTEGKVALYSSLIFGAIHLTNAVGRGASAIPQALIVSFAGYFFYLIRRVSRGNIVNSVLHGLFDFALLSGTGIAVGENYPGSLFAILVYLVIAVALLVRRHHIELPTQA